MEKNAPRDPLDDGDTGAVEFTIITTRTALEGDGRINALNVQVGRLDAVRSRPPPQPCP